MTDTVDTIGLLYAEGKLTRGQAEIRLLALGIQPVDVGEHMEQFEQAKRQRGIGS